MNKEKIITFYKTNDYGIIYAVKGIFKEYEKLIKSDVDILLSNDDIDNLIEALKELKSK